MIRQANHLNDKLTSRSSINQILYDTCITLWQDIIFCIKPAVQYTVLYDCSCICVCVCVFYVPCLYVYMHAHVFLPRLGYSIGTVTCIMSWEKAE